MNRPARAPSAVLAAAFLLVAPRPCAGQIPERFTNLQVLDGSLSRDSLVQVMRGFAFALGVRCEHCHVLAEGGGFQGADFAADDKLTKRRARYMLRMVGRLNQQLADELPAEEGTPAPVRVECKTCHRGRPKPLLLKHELELAYRDGGAVAANARYRELREEFGTAGAYDFGQWELTEWARRLDSTEDAIALLRLNFEFHPESTSIASLLAGAYERLGDLDAAVEWAGTASRLAPDNAFAARELERLRGLREEAGTG